MHKVFNQFPRIKIFLCLFGRSPIFLYVHFSYAAKIWAAGNFAFLGLVWQTWVRLSSMSQHSRQVNSKLRDMNKTKEVHFIAHIGEIFDDTEQE